MRVAIDATPLTLTSGGLVRYTRELGTALACTFPADDYILASDQPFPAPAGPPNLSAGKPPAGLIGRRWWLWGLNRELARRRADLFHGTNFSVPYVALRPSVLTLHDLSPWMEPGWHHDAGRVRRRTPLLIGLGLATVVLTDSEAVRRQAIDHFGLLPGRVAAVPLGGLPAGAPPAPAQSPAAPPYFLFVGTLEPRKNVQGLLAAWREVRRHHTVDLVLAGRRRADFPELPAEPGLRLPGEVPDADLPALYAGAQALVYPSHYEGFGLPVLEAMQSGACVITSRDPAIAEVTGGAALTAATDKELADAMTALLAFPHRAREYRERALRRGREFSWERTARLTREVYLEAQKRYGT